MTKTVYLGIALIVFLGIMFFVNFWNKTPTSSEALTGDAQWSWMSEWELLDLEREYQREKSELLEQTEELDDLILEIRDYRNSLEKPDYLSVTTDKGLM